MIPSITTTGANELSGYVSKYEITHQNFGLGYNDLMKMDPATFEEIEKVIYETIEETNKQYKNLQLNPNGDKAINNILKGPTK